MEPNASPDAPSDTSPKTSDEAVGPDVTASAGAGAPDAVPEDVIEAALTIPATDSFALAAPCFGPPRPSQGAATRCHIHPRDLGARAIGHFGCFRPAYRDTLWARAMQWLERHAERSGAAAPRDASTEVLP